MSTDVRYEDGKLYVTRVYDAPREAVFDAWIETSKTEQWWGCSNTTHVRSEIEPKVGGKYLHHMTITGVGDLPGSGRITEYDPPKRLAWVTDASEYAPAATITVDFIERGDKTEVQLVHAGLIDEIAEYVRDGWSAAFEKLDGLLTATV